MNEIETIIYMRELYKKYHDLWFDDKFIKLSKELALKLNNILANDSKEVETVKNWIDVFNKTDCVSNDYKIDFNSLFIHGFNHSEKGSYPSGVEFDYINNSTEKRELADIIFISSFYDNGKKILEKISLNQAKWGKKLTTTSSWKIDKQQLFLLSRFPKFKGVNGSLIPNIDFFIEDFSNGLGSYGLMTKENFIYVSAKDIQQYIGGKGTINLNDLKYCQNTNEFSSIFWNEIFLTQSSKRYSNNTYEFVVDFLRGHIGEIIEGEYGKNNEANNLFKGFLSSINNLSKKDNDKYQNISDFLKSYGEFDTNDNYSNNTFEFSNDIAVIQVKININKDKE